MAQSIRLLAVATLFAALAATTHAQSDDVVGVYFDPAYTVTEVVNTDVPHRTTAYLVLRNPTETAGGLGGWECRVEFVNHEPLIMWDVSGYGLNFKTPPDFLVAMTQGLPITGPDVLLASFDMLIDETTPFRIELVPLRYAPSIPDAMSYIPFDAKERLTPMATWTGEPNVATYNWIPQCEVDPDTLQFAEMIIGERDYEQMTVTNLGGGELVVDPVIEGSSEFSLNNDQGPYVLTMGESQIIGVVYTPADAGPDQASLVLGTDCDPVLLLGTGREAIRSYVVDTDSLNFGDIAAGGSFVQHFQVTNDGDVDIFVNNNAAGCGSVIVLPWTARITPGDWEVFSAYAEPVATGNLACQINLGINLPSLPLTARVVDAAEVLTLSTDVLDFSDLAPGQTAQRGVWLTNNSGSALDVSASVPGLTPFELFGLPEHHAVRIWPGNNRGFSVRFTRGTAGSYTDHLVFSVDGLSVILFAGSGPISGEELPAAVTTTRLLPNVPNPFNPETAIRYEVAKEGRVRIDVYDVMGRRVASLLDEVRGGGADQVVWQGRDDSGRTLPSGAYYVRLEGPGMVDTRKVMLLK